VTVVAPGDGEDDIPTPPNDTEGTSFFYSDINFYFVMNSYLYFIHFKLLCCDVYYVIRPQLHTIPDYYWSNIKFCYFKVHLALKVMTI
jgi:hypothetical protein